MAINGNHTGIEVCKCLYPLNSSSEKVEMRSYKFRVYPSKNQEKQIMQHLWIAKNLWNELLEHSKQTYDDFDLFPTKNTLQLMVKNTGLFSQTAQEVSHRLRDAIMRVFKLRKKGIKCGFPRFKSIDSMRSLHYPQKGFSLNKKLKVTPFGEIAIVCHRKIKSKVKTMTLKREPSGKWFAIFCSEREKQIPKTNNGQLIKNPKHLKKYENKLAWCQKLFSRKKKKSKNRKKAKLKVARIHEKVSNTRKDFLHKLSTQFINNYSLIALEKLASKEMSEKQFGKHINDASWNMFADMLAYKAESAGCKIVFVDPRGTTKECSRCHEIVNKSLKERAHNCPFCGLSIDRDINAAHNILIRATAGIAGSNACGDEEKTLSLKQETGTFRCW